MRQVPIDGVNVKDIVDKIDERGGVQHMVRADEGEFFSGFGEMYFSITNPGVVKAWHRQKVQTNLLSCVHGRLRLVLYDDRVESPTRGVLHVLEFGDGARKLVRVPPGVTYGWRNVGEIPAILANCASHAHDATQSEKIDPDSGSVPYAW